MKFYKKGSSLFSELFGRIIHGRGLTMMSTGSVWVLTGLFINTAALARCRRVANERKPFKRFPLFRDYPDHRAKATV
jgi:hypothetical protein